MLTIESRPQIAIGGSYSVACVEAVFRSLPRNTFIVADQAPLIAEKLGIPLDVVIDILQTPNPLLYPDVPPGLERIASAGSLAVVWTQGHLDANSDVASLADEAILAFQPLKIVRAGLQTHLRPFAARLSQIGIPGLIGGLNKCDQHLVLPVLSTAQNNGLQRVVAVDDLDQNLTELGELCDTVGMPYTPVLIDRKAEEQAGCITSFDALPLLPEALYLLDLDRTQIDTDAMKQDLYLRLGRCIESSDYSEDR